MNYSRYLLPYFTEYIEKKILLLTGPRQVGKTTFVKHLLPSLAYYNYDNHDDANVFLKSEWDRKKKIVVFDELHKKMKWKLWLKGIFDSSGVKEQHIIVTGSARLDITKRMGDSLAGRFFSYKLYPYDLKELKGEGKVAKNYEQLMMCGGFPEPLFEGSKKFYNLWKRSHSDLILRQDLLSLEVVKDMHSLELLIELLSHQIGSTISYRSLSLQLQKDEKTIKHWLDHLENLFIVFKVPPFSKGVTKGIKKASKYYFYDIGRIKGSSPEEEESKKLENLVALSLKKEADFLNDCFGEEYDLFFAKLQDQREVDFLITKESIPHRLIEVKLSAHEISPSLRHIRSLFKNIPATQFVKNLKKEYSAPDGIEVCSLLPYLENLSLK